MKNTYKIPEGCTSISIEQIGNKIVTEFETPNEYKKGDVITANRGIIILERKINESKFECYARLYTNIGDTNVDFGGTYDYTSGQLRLATQSEKQLLFDALAKAGKRWNAETLQIEDLKVVPRVGDCVKLSNGNGRVLFFIYNGRSIYGGHKNKGDYIDSYGKICKENTLGFDYDFCIIEILTSSKFQSEVNALGFEYDFKNDTFKEMRWVPKEGEKFWCVYFTFIPYSCTNDGESIDKELIKVGNCFKTKSECESAIEKIKNVLKSK